ncbi:glycoside hydrolase family 16 protein, partial [Conidiobolus coronatus NRRL 28638]
DNFNSLDFSTWKHDITMGGGGNNEFQLYQNNRTNSFIKNGTLYLYPTFTANNPDEVSHMLNDMEVNLYGTDPPADCTSNAFGGCWKKSDPNSGAMVNPIRSAAIRSIDSFTIKYGKIEVRARMPSGDWLWPAIW